MSLLEVEGLTVSLRTGAGDARAVRDVGFELARGESLGIVGESGCGKSMTALALMGLAPENATVSGQIRLDGCDLLGLKEADWCRLRGQRLAMVFQEPMTSLNPVHRVGRRITESLRLHRALGRSAAEDEAARLLDRVGIEEARRRLRDYPHQLSGGQRQRVMIAMALANRPDVLIADEPTTALDVTVQKQILALIAELVDELGMALILISHDLGVIAQNVQRVAVMYGGAIVEEGPTRAVLDTLAHPYSRGLVGGIPRLGFKGRLRAIAGSVPDLVHLPGGCTFAGRCPIVRPGCATTAPPRVPLTAGHFVRCVAAAPRQPV